MLHRFEIRYLNSSDVLQGDCPFARFCCNQSLADGCIRVVAVGSWCARQRGLPMSSSIVETVLHLWADGVKNGVCLGKCGASTLGKMKQLMFSMGSG